MELLRESSRSVVASVGKAQAGKISVDSSGEEPRKTLKCNSTGGPFDDALRGTPRYANPGDAMFLCLTQAQFPESGQHMHVLVTVHMGESPRINTIVRAEEQLPPNLRANRGPDRLSSEQELPY